MKSLKTSIHIYGFFLALAFLTYYSKEAFAHQWSPPVNLSLLGKNASSPKIAIDPFGNATAVWFRFDGSHLVIQTAQQLQGQPWPAEPQTLTSSNYDSFNPQIVIDSFGNTIIVFESTIDNTGVIQALFRRVGGAWESRPTLLSSKKHFSTSPKVVTNSNGEASVVWQNRTSKNQHIYLSNRSLQTNSWSSTPLLLSSSKKWNANPHLVVDCFDNTHVIWECADEKGDSSQIAVGTIEWGSKTLSSIDILSTPRSHATLPKIVSDPFGAVSAVWCEYDGQAVKIFASSKTKESGWDKKAHCLSDSRGKSTSPQIAADPCGNITVVYETILIDKTSSVFATTKTSNGIWSSPYQLSQSGKQNFNPRVAIDDFGNTAVLWHSYTNGFTYIHSIFKPYGREWNNHSTIISWNERVAFMSDITFSQTGEATAVWVLQESSSFIQASTLIN